ncbi:hypothetical protein BN1221_00350 [Brenneria goodwinii]|uniref:Uncharacterized protein n=1 Tax=Brenneria goodwinii TaxID=1109412 RepID=A0A0G4JQA4_9GAMM|nr:hypothetical protein BN1221_00350 [Brenneria goodwinii]
MNNLIFMQHKPAEFAIMPAALMNLRANLRAQSEITPCCGLKI